MSNAVVAKELRRLCYTDMKEFATALLQQLEERGGGTINQSVICEALANMDDVFLSTPDSEADNLLRKIFNKGRTKTIHVEVNAGGGYTVTFRKQVVHGARLTDALNNLLDQIVALQAMGVEP